MTSRMLRLPAAVLVAVAIPAGRGTTFGAVGVSAPEVAFQAQEPEFVDLAGPGKKIKIDETAYFTWEFVERPKMGPAILKIQVFDRNGGRRTDLAIFGRSDMPSMRGAHDSGEAAFKLNRKGDYLLPVDVVMPGGWEVLVTFKKGDAVVLRGRIAFNV